MPTSGQVQIGNRGNLLYRHALPLRRYIYFIGTKVVLDDDDEDVTVKNETVPTELKPTLSPVARRAAETVFEF